MDFLRFLEGIRTPVADSFFSAITYCGDVLFFMAVAIVVFWCVSKKSGYYILTVGFLGTIANQFMKLWFRVPRPWVLDPEFTIVEKARAAATGYSFPSGHTQNVVGTMACVMFITNKKWLRAGAVALMLLVPFSRMYLGCHTPADVAVAFVLALVLAVMLRPLVTAENHRLILGRVLFLSIIVCIVYWAFVTFYPFPANIDQANLMEGTKNAYTLLGCLLGLVVSKTLDERWLNFPVEAVWWAQILKAAIGFGLLLLIQTFVKIPLRAVLPDYVADMLRYFLMVFFAGTVWPLTFPWFSKLGRGNVKEKTRKREDT